MQVIWKYPIDEMRVEIDIPIDARFLSVQMQYGKPQLWALVDPKAEKKTYHFAVIGTGHEQSDDILSWRYIGTFQTNGGSLVFHLFQIE